MAALIVFVLALALFLAVGLAAAVKRKADRTDYYLASRGVTPMMAGLSAVATNNSGYMFIGVIGYTYAAGLAAVWLMIGWILGDFIASLFVHARLRAATARSGEASFGAVLAAWNGGDLRVFRIIAGLITVIFLGAYSAAQMTAGGKALEGVFGWSPQAGALIVAVLVFIYSAAGGIRASIWTDVVQSFVMLAAMGLLFAVGVAGLGGIGGAWSTLNEIEGFMDWTPDDLAAPCLTGIALFAFGWMFAGLSVIGQPHVMVRFMALDTKGGMWATRAWYYIYFTLFYALATGVGMLARHYLPDLANLDPELALPRMAQELLHPALVGLILAGLFAATISTADSLVLSCSAAITHDLAPERLETPWRLKAVTGGVVLAAFAVALVGPKSVFDLVILSWSTLACAFGPVLIARAFGARLSDAQATAMVLIGPAVAFAWRGAGLHNAVYEGLPGILAGLAVWGLWRQVRPIFARA